jgi:tape measure domain-containing protein
MRKTTATLRLTEQEVKGLTSTFSQLGTTLSGVTTRANATATAIGNTRTSVGGLSSSLLGLAAGVLTVQSLTSAMQDVVRTGIEMQNLRTSFNAIAGGAQAGGQQFAFVVKTANTLGLELSKLADQYRSLTAATRGTALEGQATRDLFTALTQASTTFGLSTDQTGRALLAFQQIVSKGKVSMEELRGQLGEALPGAMQIAARAYGTNTKALEEMIAKGLDAVEFTQRFTQQLKVEAPLAAERAGKGIAQLGNEILLLKDRMAQSGLLQFLDAAAGKIAGLFTASRTAAENARAQVEQMLGPLSKWTTEAEKAAMTETAMGRHPESILQRDIEDIRKRAVEQERAAARQKEINEQQIANQAILRDQASNNKALTTTLEDQKKARDALNKSSALTPEIYGKENGTLQQQIQFLERRKDLTAKSLEAITATITGRPERAGPVPAELVAQQAELRRQYSADVTAIEAKKQAIQDLAAAQRKADQAREEAERKRQQAQEEEARLDRQQAEEVARVHATSMEALRQLASRYTEVRAERDADRASMLAASLATSQYAEKARELAAAIADVQRVEAQLPALRSQAKASAAEFEAIKEIMQDFEPDIQLTRREQLAKSFEDLKKVTSDPETLARGRAQMERTLAFESMQEDLETLREFTDRTFDKMGDALTDFVFHGKASFKDMVSSIAEDFYRLSLQTIGKMATQEGGWLDVALKAVLKLGSAAAGAGGGGGAGTAVSALAFVGGDAPGMQHGGPVVGGQPYWVGERGPELFVPRQSGTVVPNGQAMGGTTVVNVHVSGVQNAQSFVASRGAVSRAMMQAMQQAQRNM